MAAAITILGLVGAAVSSALLYQQRHFRQARDFLGVREGVRDAVQVLSTDIRSASVRDTIRLMTDSAFEAFAAIGSSVVCRVISANTLAMSDDSPGGGTLSSFLTFPDTGDFALLYVAGPPGDTSPRWERHRIVAFAETTPSAGCLVDSGAPREGFRLTLESAPLGEVRRGVPVRFIRRGRYSLYRSSDLEWYLGYRRCNAVGPSVCGGIQPVSGPYRRYNPDRNQTGFLFEYFDARGDPLASDSPLAVARIDISARARRTGGRMIGGEGTAIADSARASIAIRNR